VTTIKYLGLAVATLLPMLTPLAHAETPSRASVAPPTDNELDNDLGFAADRVEFDQTNNIVTASGDVRLNHAGSRLRAGKIVYNRSTGIITASENVSITNPQGDLAFGASIVLSDSLKDGAIEDLLVVMADGGRLAAKRGTGKDGAYTLERATYSPCAVIDENNCPKRPAWLITAQRVNYDPKTKHVRYHNARIEVFGLPLIPIPYFWHTTSDEPATGLLTPQIEYTANNGLEFRQPIHFHLSGRRDLTLTPYLFTASPPALEANYRQLTKTGAFNVTAFVTDSVHTPIAYVNGTPVENLRGYLDANGKFQLNPEWNIHGSVRIASDRTLLSNYEISFDDRLRTNLTLERISPTSYFSLVGWGIETLRPLERQGLTPIALPEIDYRKRADDGVLGGKIDLQINSLAIARTGGQDTQRAFAGAQWTLRKLNDLGQEIVFTAYGRGDLYHSTGNYLTTTLSYQGQSGWQTRAIGALAAELRWPLIGELFGGTQRLTPRIQIVASPPTANLSLPNEDARAIELDDSNLFALNRFPGYDRWEDGTRVTYGADWALDHPGFSIAANIGQSYRFSSATNILANGTGLSSQVSDIVGRTTIKYRSLVSFTHRYRLDKGNLAIRRNEIDATVGSPKTYVTVSYLKLNRHISTALEDLQDHQEIRLGGRVQLSKFWSAYGSTIVDLTTQKLDPQSLTNGYSPVRHRLGLAYDNDCLTLDFSWRRDFSTTVGAQTGSVFQFRVAFRNLGR